MKVLVVGGGGREHTLVWKIAQSPLVDKIYCAPGNGGIMELAECVDIKAEDIEGLLQFVKNNSIDLTVVGPEAPLSKGISDLFEANGLRVFGPCQKGAQLESSKAFSKDFMNRHGIPTAKYKVYENAAEAKSEIQSFGYPVVIKADGLAAGKGVIIAESRQEAEAAVESLMEKQEFGEAGSKVVIEEFLIGHEASILAFTDGNSIIPMVSAQDYKRALDGDRGLNTGGMGAVSPAFHYNEEIAYRVYNEIMMPTLKGLKEEGIKYKGVLYFGLMLTDNGPKVLEYNSRFGDPETEVVLRRLETDLVEIINAVIDERLGEININWNSNSAVCVVMASGGYPGNYSKGYEIKGLESVSSDVVVFHAGTTNIGGKVVTSGGRVLVVSALGKNTDEAREKVYKAIQGISFNEAHYRKDIGKKTDLT